MEYLVFILLFISVESFKDYGIGMSKKDQWWGPEELKYIADDSIRPFRIEFGDEMIQELRYHLNYHRPSKPTFPHVGFQYGFNTREVPKWSNYWANVYPFKEREAYLNQFPQYKTYIQGLDMHFIWIKPRVPPGVEIVPLLLLHGWPGSVREFYEAIPLLTAVCDNRDFAVEVVVPSLPGFGYSDPAVRPGLSADNMTTIFKNLMHRLGHERFYVQGGDWGSIIGSDMATIYPENVLGYHTNLAFSFSPQAFNLILIGDRNPTLFVDPKLADRLYPLMTKFLGLLNESGYFHLLATKTDTIGIALSDSPIGLLTFILQTMSSATNTTYTAREDGGLGHYAPEALIDNLMYYWNTNSITTASRIYVETLNKQFSLTVPSTPTAVPTWAVQARFEILYQPPTILKTKFINLLHTTVLQDGGHFLALEKPEFFAQDVLKALEAFRNWHRVKREL